MIGGTWLADRLDVSRWTAVLAVGDLVVLTAFVAAGQYRHSGVNPFTLPGQLLGALAPFLIGWVAVALIGGLYTHDALLGPRRMVSWTLPAWILGAIIALALRGTELFPGTLVGLFPFVAMVFGGLLIVTWRGVAAVVLPRPE